MKSSLGSPLFLLFILRLCMLPLSSGWTLRPRQHINASLSEIGNLTATNNPTTFEDNIRSGIQFMQTHGVGPDCHLRSIQVGARQRTGSRRHVDFTRIVITMEDDAKTTVYTTRNYLTARRVWHEPERDPPPQHAYEKTMRLFDFQQMRVTFKEAFGIMLAAGYRGPWKYVQIITNEFVGGGEEPFYSFQTLDDVDPIWVGAISGNIMTEFDPGVNDEEREMILGPGNMDEGDSRVYEV